MSHFQETRADPCDERNEYSYPICTVTPNIMQVFCVIQVEKCPRAELTAGFAALPVPHQRLIRNQRFSFLDLTMFLHKAIPTAPLAKPFNWPKHNLAISRAKRLRSADANKKTTQRTQGAGSKTRSAGQCQGHE